MQRACKSRKCRLWLAVTAAELPSPSRVSMSCMNSTTIITLVARMYKTRRGRQRQDGYAHQTEMRQLASARDRVASVLQSCTGCSHPIYDLAEFLRTRPRPRSPLLVERRRARQESQEATSRENGPPARILVGWVGKSGRVCAGMTVGITPRFHCNQTPSRAAHTLLSTPRKQHPRPSHHDAPIGDEGRQERPLLSLLTTVIACCVAVSPRCTSFF